MLKLKGSMRLYVLDTDSGRILNDTGFRPNMLVETGKEFILNEIFNVDKWNSGDGIQSAALGGSTNTNAGVVGPTAGLDILKAGAAWGGVVEDDWRLSDEFARSVIISATRTDQYIVAIAQFVDGQLPFVSGVCKIREAGLFLHPSTAPIQDPQADPAQKPYAMVARRVYFGETATHFVDRPFYKIEDGNPLMFEYKLELL
jgi:hypothetical protein